MRWLLYRQGPSLVAALVLTAVVLGVVGRLTSAPTVATPAPRPSTSAPPQALFLFEDEQKALQGVLTIANEQAWGTAFLIDGQGDFLTASGLVSGQPALRLIDNTGGTHQVRVVGTDDALGIAMVRAVTDASPLTLGDSSPVAKNDPLVLLASPKVATLQPATSARVSALGGQRWDLELTDHPENIGGPLLGAGAKVLGVLTTTTAALPVDLAQTEVAAWRAQAGTLVPLAPFPDGLILRGSDVTSTPPPGASVVSISPSQASRSQEATITIQGSGFVKGPALALRFDPLAGGSGGFQARAVTVTSATTITAKVPAGAAVQDYVIELINGDGGVIDSRVAFTVTP